MDFKMLLDSLKASPIQGIPLGKDCYKIRLAIASKGKGKSGGSRVIACIKVYSESIFLLSIYDKSDKETIPNKGLDYLLKKAGLF
jgi:hypothetical protein